MPAQNQLVSGLGANHANPPEPGHSRYGFRTADVMSNLSPLPVVLIESAGDTASPQRFGKALFAAARDPKQYLLIKAENHRFSGARDQFYSALANAMTWIRQVRGINTGHMSTVINGGGQSAKYRIPKDPLTLDQHRGGLFCGCSVLFFLAAASATAGMIWYRRFTHHVTAQEVSHEVGRVTFGVLFVVVHLSSCKSINKQMLKRSRS